MNVMSNDMERIPVTVGPIDGYGYSDSEFLNRLQGLLRSYGIKYADKTPKLGGQSVDLQHLYKNVVMRGGFTVVSREKHWRFVTAEFTFPRSCTNASYQLRMLYYKWLARYEETYFPGWVPIDHADIPPSFHAYGVPQTGNPNLQLHDKPQGAKPTFTMPPKYPDMRQRTQHLSRANIERSTSSPAYRQNAHNQAPQPVPVRGGNIHRKPPPPPLAEKRPLISQASRVIFALQSQLPNEVDWALNLLLTVTHDCQVDCIEAVAPFPLLLEFLVALGKQTWRPMFKNEDPVVPSLTTTTNGVGVLSSDRNDSRKRVRFSNGKIRAVELIDAGLLGIGEGKANENQSESVLDAADGAVDNIFHDMNCDGRLAEIQRERFSTILTILSNLSLIPLYTPTMATSTTLLSLLVDDVCGPVKIYSTDEQVNIALDIISNLASFVVIPCLSEPLRTSLLQVVYRHIVDPYDRKAALECVAALGRFCIPLETVTWLQKDDEVGGLETDATDAREADLTSSKRRVSSLLKGGYDSVRSYMPSSMLESEYATQSRTLTPDGDLNVTVVSDRCGKFFDMKNIASLVALMDRSDPHMMLTVMECLYQLTRVSKRYALSVARLPGLVATLVSLLDTCIKDEEDLFDWEFVEESLNNNGPHLPYVGPLDNPVTAPTPAVPIFYPQYSTLGQRRKGQKVRRSKPQGARNTHTQVIAQLDGVCGSKYSRSEILTLGRRPLTTATSSTQKLYSHKRFTPLSSGDLTTGIAISQVDGADEPASDALEDLQYGYGGVIDSLGDVGGLDETDEAEDIVESTGNGTGNTSNPRNPSITTEMIVEREPLYEASAGGDVGGIELQERGAVVYEENVGTYSGADSGMQANGSVVVGVDPNDATSLHRNLIDGVLSAHVDINTRRQQDNTRHPLQSQEQSTVVQPPNTHIQPLDQIDISGSSVPVFSTEPSTSCNHPIQQANSLFLLAQATTMAMNDVPVEQDDTEAYGTDSTTRLSTSSQTFVPESSPVVTTDSGVLYTHQVQGDNHQDQEHTYSNVSVDLSEANLLMGMTSDPSARQTRMDEVASYAEQQNPSPAFNTAVPVDVKAANTLSATQVPQANIPAQVSNTNDSSVSHSAPTIVSEHGKFRICNASHPGVQVNNVDRAPSLSIVGTEHQPRVDWDAMQQKNSLNDRQDSVSVAGYISSSSGDVDSAESELGDEGTMVSEEEDQRRRLLMDQVVRATTPVNARKVTPSNQYMKHNNSFHPYVGAVERHPDNQHQPLLDPVSAGIQLNAALILRNIARTKDVSELLAPHIERLTELAASGHHFSKVLVFCLSHM
eukprot:CFRG8089T1